MLEAADTIFTKALVKGLQFGVDTSDVDAAVITCANVVTLITQAGAAETRTLENGAEGQVKILINTVYAAATVVAAKLLAGTGITFGAAGHAWMGVFAGGVWHTLATGIITGDGGPTVG